MAVHLWDNFVGPLGFGGTFGGTFELGMAFTVATDANVTYLRWYAVNTTTSDKPAALRLWSKLTGAKLVEITSVPHSGAVGWQSAALATPLNVPAGTDLVVSAQFNGGTSMGNASSIPAAPSPLANDDAGKGRQGAFGSGNVIPATVSSNAWGVDVAVETGSNPSSGGDQVTDAALNAKLIAWFSDSGDNTHHTDLPWETKGVVDSVQTVVNNIPQVTDSAWTAALKLWQIAGALTNAEIAAWNLFAQRSPSQLTGGSGGGGSAFFGSGGHQVAQSAEDVLALAQLLVALKRNALVGFPGSPWVMAATTSFDTDLAWGEPADLYVVSFTDLGSNLVNVSPGGVNVSYRLAWWTPLIGAFGQQRGFIDTPDAHLWRAGERMPGLLLHSVAGGAGTVQAWTYD